MLVTENDVGLQGFEHSMKYKSAFFYKECGLVAYTNSVWLQCLFEVTIILFKRVGLWANVLKMFAMVCQTSPIVGRQSTPAYGSQMARKGDSH